VLAGIVVVYLLALRGDSALPVFWAIGIAFGFVVQRSRFCFVAGFRDLFLAHQGRMMRGILAGLAVAAIGFAMVMATVVPNPASGVLPSDAHILPLGLATVLGGLMFGVGMVLAGGCVSGSLYRMGEGYLGSWVAIGGVMIGLYALNRTWNWWWDFSIASDRMIWLPGELGYTGAIVLTGALLGAALLAVGWWERRSPYAGFTIPITVRSSEDVDDKRPNELVSLYRTIVRREWSPVTGGVLLALVNVGLFIRYRPLGVVGEISRWSSDVAGQFGAGVGTLKGLDGLAGCVPRAPEGMWFTEGFMLNGGIVMGAFAAAVLSQEFKLRVPRQPRRYLQSLGGGVVMGYGAGLGLGCTIGAFFSAIPSLALNGWVYAASLAVGAYVGVVIIRRFP
jgi:uncharacterized membrane protein YedE/YeeE